MKEQLANFLPVFYQFVERNSWFILLAAGVFEVAWALSLKLSHGYTKLTPTLATIPLALASTALLAMSMRAIPMSVAYMVWAGLGAMGTVIIGMMYFGEQVTLGRLLCIALIVAGVVGLKFTVAPATGG
jgi:quaternary ammonium compound-resistance protein SugE